MLLARFYERLIRHGSLTIIDADGRAHACGEGEPQVTVRLHDRRLHWKLYLHPEIAAGEAYMNGTLTVENGGIFDLIDLIASNMTDDTLGPASRLLNSAEVFRRLQSTIR